MPGKSRNRLFPRSFILTFGETATATHDAARFMLNAGAAIRAKLQVNINVVFDRLAAAELIVENNGDGIGDGGYQPAVTKHRR